MDLVTRPILDGIPKVNITFEHHLAPVCPCVLSLEDHGVDNNNETDQAVRSNAERDSKVKILHKQSASHSKAVTTGGSKDSPGYPLSGTQ